MAISTFMLVIFPLSEQENTISHHSRLAGNWKSNDFMRPTKDPVFCFAISYVCLLRLCSAVFHLCTFLSEPILFWFLAHISVFVPNIIYSSLFFWVAYCFSLGQEFHLAYTFFFGMSFIAMSSVAAVVSASLKFSNSDSIKMLLRHIGISPLSYTFFINSATLSS